MIEASIDVFAVCSGDNTNGLCRIEVGATYDPITSFMESHHDWLEERGWLVVGDVEAYCPECRYELHD